MARKIVVMGGDGIGPEVTAQSVKLLAWLKAHKGLDIDIDQRPYGLAQHAMDGKLISAETMAALMTSDAVLFGATGGPGYDDIPVEIRRASSLLAIRKTMDVYANLRPVKVYEPLLDISPLKPELARGVDLIIVRELTSGLYFGQPKSITELNDGTYRAIDTATYTTGEIRRAARAAFDLARTRSGRVTSVDKSNVLDTGRLWRREVHNQHADGYEDIILEDMLGDNCGLQLGLNPLQFDVLVTDNMFGDILSDVAAAAAGGLGMLPSASLGAPDSDGKMLALYEPVHGSAPDIAGQGVANPLASMLCIPLMLRYSLGDAALGDEVEAAVVATLADGVRTRDICPQGITPVGTEAMGDAVIAHLAA